MSNEILILGAGGHAKVVIDILNSQKEKIKGLLDDDKSLLGDKIMGEKVIDTIGALDDYSAREFQTIISIGSPSIRSDIYREVKDMGFEFSRAIHPGASISEFSSIDEGSIVNTGVSIHPDVDIKHNVILGMNATVSHDTVIEPHCHISPGVNITGNSYIGEGAELGTGCVILPGCSVEDNAVIGAGAVVTEDIPANSTAIGVPAKVK